MQRATVQCIKNKIAKHHEEQIWPFLWSYLLLMSHSTIHHVSIFCFVLVLYVVSLGGPHTPLSGVLYTFYCIQAICSESTL